MDAPEPSLRDVQRWIGAHIQPETTVSTAGDVRLNPQRNIPGISRLSVYAHGYQARLRQALAEVYESVHQVLGTGAFSELVDSYARRFPSRDYNLNFSGRHLPEFLVNSLWVQRLPFLADLAQLEWQVCQAFHAISYPPITPASLHGQSFEDWHRVRFIFQPSVSLVRSAWPILDIWEVRHRPRSEVNIDLVERPHNVVVSRSELQVRCQLVNLPQAILLEALLAGQTLDETCERLSGDCGENLPPIYEWFFQWTQQGWIVRWEQTHVDSS